MLRTRKEILLMRTGLLLALLGAIALSSGCDPKASNTNVNSNANANRVFVAPKPLKSNSDFDPAFKSCNDYYPLVPGSVAKYVINYSSGLVGNVTTVVDATEENGRKGFVERTQIVDSSGGYQINQDIERRFVCDGNKVQLLTEKTDTRLENNPSSSLLNYRDNSYQMIEPSSLSQTNTTWSVGFHRTFNDPGKPPATDDTPIVIVYTVKGQEDVTLPTGKVKAVKIEKKVGENQVTEYYARGLGLVRRVSKEGTNWELKEYSGLKPVE
jgi:hypothetical protein